MFKEVLRNTPTGVGKTHRKIDQTWMNWKHPHGRGEDHNRLLMNWATDTRYANYI